jgi:transposase-like protein
VVNLATVIATAVNAQGKREVLGLDVVTSEDGAGVRRCAALFRLGRQQPR